MQIVKKVVEFTNRDDSYFCLIPIGDIHLGHKNIDFKTLEKVIEIIKSTPRCFWLGTGDYANCLTVTDKRFDFNSVDPNYMTPDLQYRKIEELFHPIKDRCIGLLDGNHDYEYWKRYNHNYVDDLSYSLKVPYLSIDAYIRFVLERNSGKKSKMYKFDIFAHHGWSAARSIGGRVNNIMGLASIFPNLHLYLQAHNHLLGSIPPRIQLSVNNNLEVVDNKQYFVFTGSFLKGYVPGSMSYVEAKTYIPTTLGSPMIKIELDEGSKEPFSVKVDLIQ